MLAMVRSATGPTSAALGVRTPPVRITVTWLVPSRFVITTATVVELVTTVRPGMDATYGAIAHVVVPAESPIAAPGWIIRAARWAIACLAGWASWLLAANPGSKATRRART